MMDAFKAIYENAHWGESRLYAGYGGSGLGSSVQFVRELIPRLQRYIAENQISSFLDVGCGECEWQRVIDWEALECKYIGIELLSDVVERVRSDLADRKNMTFIQGNCLDMTLPATDLAFVKEVFQHWPIHLKALSHLQLRRVLLLPTLQHLPLFHLQKTRSSRRGC